MWLPVVLQLCTAVAAQELPPLPRGAWRPVEVAIAQDIREDGTVILRCFEVTLHFDPSPDSPEPDRVQASYQDVLRLFARRWWLFDSTTDARLFAGEKDLGPCQSLLYGDGPLRLRFRVPDAATETLQLTLAHHPFVPEAFTAHVDVSGAGSALLIGPLAFAFERAEPVTYPFSYQEEIPGFRRGPGHNYWYSRPGPAWERGTKLLFRLQTDADPDLVPYWFEQITLTVGERTTTATEAIMAHATETGVAWLAIFVPLAPEDVPDTFALDIVGERIIAGDDISEESVFDLPLPALPR